jgi:GAF domain-containing protein
MSSGTQEGEPPGGAGQLQRRLDRYRSLFDQAPVAYLITDRSGLRDHLRRLDGRGPHTWELRIRPRRGRPRPVAVAFTAGQVVWTSDLRADPRWPRLAPAARTNQVRGVLSAPVLLDDRPIGTCNALTGVPRAWTEADAGAVRAFAGMLGRLIGSITDARHKTELTVQLQSALNSRVLIEQAKGVLMERRGVDAEHAFELLRHRARSSERKRADVARELLTHRG